MLDPARLILTLVLASTAAGADWPQFQGPNRNGRSAETDLVRSWPDGGPPVEWTVGGLGPGFGGAAVRDGEVFLLDRVPERGDLLRCLDFASGAERWRHEYEAPGRLPYDGSRGVPTVTGDRVYTIGSFGQVHCFDRSTHRPVWSLDMTERLGGEMPAFGWAQSPLLHDGRLIIAPLGKQTGLVALDARTGEVAWRTGPVGSSHSNPVLMRLAGTLQLIMLSRDGDTGMLSSFDPGTGSLLWRSNGYLVKRSIPAPTRVDDERLFVTGGYRAGSLLLGVTRQEDGFSTRELFRAGRGSQIHQPMLVGEHLYLLANENWNDRRRHDEGGLMCLALDGTERWRTGDEPYLGRGGMILADGMLIVQDGYSGTIRLVDPQPNGFRELARCNVFGITDDKDHQIWAPLALAHGRLIVRSQSELKCIDLRRK